MRSQIMWLAGLQGAENYNARSRKTILRRRTTCQYLALLCIAVSSRCSFVATFASFFIESSTTVSRQDGWIAPSQLQGRHVWKFGKHLLKYKYQHSQWSFDKYHLIRLFIVTTCLASWLPRFLFTWGWPRSELQAIFFSQLQHHSLTKIIRSQSFIQK